MKVNLYRDSNVRTAIFRAISADPNLIVRIMEARNPELEEKGDPCEDVVFTINGIEVDFNNFVDGFANEYNKLIDLEVNKRLQEKYRNLIDSIEEIQEELEFQKNTIRNYNEH